jgi:hypothetical protein
MRSNRVDISSINGFTNFGGWVPIITLTKRQCPKVINNIAIADRVFVVVLYCSMAWELVWKRLGRASFPVRAAPAAL